MYRSNVAGGLAAKLAGKPVIWGIHCSSLEPLRFASRALARLGGVLAKWTADFVINCSTRSAELHRKLGYSAAPGAVIHNGYDPSIWYPDEAIRRATRDSLGFAVDDFVVGSIARWHPQKDIPNLLQAAKLAHDRGVPLRCLLVGAGLGADNGALMKEIERAGCGEFVVPLGSRSDVRDLARALDLHVLASCGAEAFPNVVAETMLSGTVNVVTDVGDSAFIVADTGRVVPPREPGQLADAIVEAHRERSESRDEWTARGLAARARISGNFSFDRMLRSYEHIWRKVAERPAR
jgi:glycosyltransferase involved in cell wall biosynthesis